MTGQEIREVERKVVSILKILNDSAEPVGAGRVGMILADGLNLAAVAAEAGIEAKHPTMSGVIDFKRLRSLQDLHYFRE
jgi:repressor of nif and glnA expression